MSALPVLVPVEASAGQPYLENNVLYILGTDGPDDVQVSDDGNQWKVKVTYDDGDSEVELWFAQSETDSIVVKACAGDDQVQMSSGETDIPFYIYGDAGDDQIQGGSYSDTIFGGPGSDQIQGNDGNDTLVGGSGTDSIQGGNGSNSITQDGSNGTGTTVCAFNNAPEAFDANYTVNQNAPLSIVLEASDPDSDPLTFDIQYPTTHGVLIGSDDQYTYQANPGFTGIDSFAFTANDGNQNSNTASIEIDVQDLTAPIISATLTPVPNPAGWHNSDVTVTYDCTDSWSSIQSCPAPFNVTVEGANQLISGEAVDQAGNTASTTVTVNLDKSNPFLGISAPNDGDLVIGSTISVIGQATDATSTVEVTVNGTPATLDGSGNFGHSVSLVGGQNILTVIATDAAGNATTEFVTVTLQLNQAPVAQAQSLQVDEDGSIAMILTSTDADGDVLTYQIVGLPTQGVLTGTAPNLSYQPNANFNGSDSFTFRVNDGEFNSADATIDITINAINDVPQVSAQSLTTNEDQDLGITLMGSDVDGDTLTYQVVVQPLGGTLTGTAPNVGYQPDLNFNGTDSFTYRVSDGTTDSVDATVTITVSAINDSPVADAISIGTNEDTDIAITLTGSDLDGDTLTYQLVSQPTLGILTGTSPNLVYQPNTDINGIDSFTYRVNDGFADSVDATVQVAIASVNDFPVANAQSVTTQEDTSLAVTLFGSDIDGDALTYQVVVQPLEGTLTGTAPDLTYHPNANFDGADQIGFTVSDGLVTSSQALIDITVAAVNDAPVITSDPLLNAQENQPYVYQVVASDEDGDALGYSLLAAPAGMSVDSDGLVTWTPLQSDVGPQSVSVRVADGNGGSVIQSYILLVEVTPNSPPAFTSTPVTVGRVNDSYQYLLSAQDPDGDNLGFALETGPLGMTLTGALLEWVPSAAQLGNNAVTVSVGDGIYGPVLQSFGIIVEDPNESPVITSSAKTLTSVGEDYIYTIVASDADGDLLTFLANTLPAGMSLDSDSGELSWQPEQADIGAHLVSISVDDGNGGVIGHDFTLMVVGTDFADAAYMGTEFWVPRFQRPTDIQLIISAEVSTSGSVDILAKQGEGSIPFDLLAGQVIKISVPRPESAQNYSDYGVHSGIRDWGVRIGALDPISVRVVYYDPAASDAMLALPVRAFGTEYLVSTLGGSPTGLLPRAVIMASDDNTQVTVTASRHLQIEGNPILPGEQYTFTLNRGQDFHLRPLPYGHDFSGTAVTSDKPIGVYSGHDCANVNGTYCNRLIEQLASVDMWKNEYLTTPLRTRYGDTFRVYAAFDNTTVSVDGSLQGVINRSEFLTFDLDQASVISADLPIQVIQHANGLSKDKSKRQLDPFSDFKGAALQRSEFWATEQVIEIDPAPAPNWAFVLMPTSGTSDLVIDGLPVGPGVFGRNILWDRDDRPSPGAFSGAQIALSPGVHRFSASTAFGLYKNTEGLSNYADPSMVIVPATDNFQRTYSFQTAAAGNFARHFINVTVPSSAIDSVILDGQAIDPAHFTPLAASDYSFARVGVNLGSHYISADEPFGLMVYGFDDADAYTYPGGWALNQSGITDSMLLGVDFPTQTVNNQVCVDASALDAAGGAIAFAQIEISITGANPDALRITANQSGAAQYCYTGIFTGTDQVNARSGAAQQSIQIDWLADAGNDAPAITSAPVLLTPDAATYRYPVAAFDADGDLLTYVLLAGPAGMTIDPVSGLVNWNAEFGSYPVSIQVSDPAGVSDQQDFQLLVNRKPVIGLLPVGMIISDYRYVSLITATDPDGDELYYTLENGTADFSIDNRTGDISSFTLLAAGNYPITISVSDRKGGVTYYSYTLLVAGVNTAPTLSAGQTSLSAFGGDSVDFSVSPFDANGDEVLVSIISNSLPGLVLDAVSGQINWTSTNADVGTHQVSLIATDEWGASSAPLVLELTVNENLIHQIVSLAPTEAIVGVEYQYPVIVDDPEDRPIDVRITWFDRASGMYLDDNDILRWTPPNDNYIRDFGIRITATDSLGREVEQWINFTVKRNNPSAPQLDGGVPNQAIVGYPLSYQLMASDADGDPVDFSLISGPDGMTVSSDGLIDWTPAADQVGLQPVLVHISDGDKAVAIDWQIGTLLTPPPLAANILVEPQFIPNGDSANLTLQFFGGIDPVIDSVLLDGTPITLVNNQATLTPNTVGRHDIVVNLLDDGEITSFSSFVSVTDPSDVDAPVVAIESPGEGETVTTLADVIGTVQDANLVDVYLYARRVDSNDRIDLYRGEDAFASELIGVFDPTLLRNGQYQIVLQAIDANNQSAVVQTTVVVEGGMKIGNFSMTFADLSIPMAGIPIQVMRIYDTRRKHENLDFGYGWSVDYQNISVEESSDPAVGWIYSQEYHQFSINGVPTTFSVACMRSTTNKTVTVTLPNDDVEEFTIGLDGLQGSLKADNDLNCDLVASTIFDLRFDAKEGTTSKLEAYDNRNMTLSNIGEGILIDDITDSQPSNVVKYRLTTKSGFVYNLDQDFGIETVSDPNGNTLTYSDAGISHSSGTGIVFNRDIDGRIDSIVDPSGQIITYDYSATGDLVAVTDRETNTSTYEYDDTHGLTDLFDALDRRVLRNIYDDDGRLIAQEDSDGNRTEFLHDIAGRTSQVTDRLGRITQFGYDERGNVTSEVDALGNLTSYTFDANDNQLSKTDALGNTSSATFDDEDNQLTQTDELGRVTTFTYNEFGKEVEITDPKGNAYTNDYDTVGNLVGITDPDGNLLGVILLNSHGLVDRMADTYDNFTDYTYDGDGNKLTEIDALGNVKTFTYDDNGNLLTETVQRTINGTLTDETTTFVYDSLDRLVQTTGALGNVTHQVYDEVGNKITDTDALGRVTTYTYDAYRRLTRTDYPDGTFTTMAYDAEGNLLSETDANGNTTGYVYDALNRLIQTNYADGSNTQSTYDALGRVLTETDELGNVTSYEYDAAGQRTQLSDALANVTAYTYDANGNLETMADARGNTWQYAYDVYDNRTVTTWPDLSTSSEITDRLGRVTDKVDQNGNSMSFAYDALGRLLTVTDALGNITAYGYDEVGNKLAQTDAAGRTTTWTYDALGRELTRSLPLGQQESQQYDAVGNRISSTDFNSQLTSFVYDNRDRLDSVTYNDASVETSSYDNHGNRTGANDR
ncbi:MAG: tandem-95 repeat protein, partial [Gammaproteobacteria bacterium]|nr:tandem-95 repeat protein [Gammaproteobacteria bacterium]